MKLKRFLYCSCAFMGGFPNILIGTSQLFPDKAFFITGDMLS